MKSTMDDLILGVARAQSDAYSTAYQAGHEAGSRDLEGRVKAQESVAVKCCAESAARLDRIWRLEALLVRVREPWQEDEHKQPAEFRAKADKLGADIDAALADKS